MKNLLARGRTLALLAVIVALLALFIYVGLRSGPLAPVAVTVATVESRVITPMLFGIGTVEARHAYKIGPTFAGRVQLLHVDVGDYVTAGQTLGEMDPVDLDDRVRAQTASSMRAQAMVREAEARQAHARTQALRYEQLFAVRSSSEEVVAAKRQEMMIADAALSAARADLARARSEHQALVAQQRHLRLVAPSDGIVAARAADPGTTIVAGQAVVEVIDPTSFWINVRFDQIGASGLAAGLPARIMLRSRSAPALTGRVLRVEPKADAVTEEMLVKVRFDRQPEPLPPIGELAEVTLGMPELPAAAVIPNAAVQRAGEKLGVWQIVDGDLRFAPVTLGASDLDGRVQVLDGIKSGDQIVIYSEKALTLRSRIHVVERIPGVAR